MEPPSIETPSHLGLITNPDGSKHIIIDGSATTTYCTCPREAEYAYIKRRKLNVESPALRFGKHIHTALAHHYTLRAFGSSWTEMIHKTLTDAFTETPCATEGWRNLGQAVEVYNAYLREYPGETDFTVAFHNNKPLIELPFVLHLGTMSIMGTDYNIHYAGRIDLVVEEAEGLFVVDHKTTSVGGDTFWAAFDLSAPMRGYVYAAQLLTGKPIVGYIVNALFSRKPTRTGCPIEFGRTRYFTHEPPGQIDEWLKNLYDIVGTFVINLERGYFPRHTNNCKRIYGLCDYHSVCMLPADSRPGALGSARFTENLWTPLE